MRPIAGDGWLRDLGFAVYGAPGDSTPPEKSTPPGWELLWNVNTDLPYLLQGPGLDVASLPGPEKRGPRWAQAELEPRLRAFLARMPQLERWRVMSCAGILEGASTSTAPGSWNSNRSTGEFRWRARGRSSAPQDERAAR
ncbi:MAG: hypothetical protein AAFX50_08125 [Acidobacteriota bacterium]